MLQVYLLYQLPLVLAVLERIILEGQVKVLLHRSVHSCQPLEEMVLTNPINTQEDLAVLELVEMLICTVAVDQLMVELTGEEDILSSEDVLLEDIPVVVTILEPTKVVQHLVQVERTDGLDRI